MNSLRDSRGRFLPKPATNGSVLTQNEMVQHGILSMVRGFQENIAVINETLGRRKLFQDKWLDPRRNINDECGYPSTSVLTVQDYKELYERESTAARVVEVVPQETWKVNPYIYETEDIEEQTAFEKALEELSTKLSGRLGEETSIDGEDVGSWFKDEQLNPIWEILFRIDKLSGIGHYGVLLLGIGDGQGLDKPVALNSEGNTELLYIRAFDESLAVIATYEVNKTNKRYGQPNFYNLTLSDPNASGLNANIDTVKVHWSRIIHIADNIDSSELYGTPRQRPVLNRLLDLTKLYGGSAEMYWKGAFPGISLETHPELGGDVELPSDIKDQMENWMNGLQRYLAIAGTTAKSLAPQVVDPSNHIDGQLDAICIKIGIPKRIFMGTERGKLASTQDESTWNERVSARRKNYATPRIIVPFINRLIILGVLPKPENGFRVGWGEEETLKAGEQADIAVKRLNAMTSYVAGNLQRLMSPQDFLVRELGYNPEKAREILEARKEVAMLTPEVPKELEEPGQGDQDGNPKLPAKQGKDPRRMSSDSKRMDGPGES